MKRSASEKETALLKRRISWSITTVLILYFLLLLRLYSLQGIDGSAYRELALQERLRKITLPAGRGEILDRYGRPLAVSLYCGTLGFDPHAELYSHLSPLEASIRKSAIQNGINKLADILHLSSSDITTTIQNAVNAYPTTQSRWLPIAKGITLTNAEEIKALNIPGFAIQNRPERVYSSGENAAQVIGFLGPNGNGAAGLELGCQKWLVGHPGYAFMEADPHNREIPGTLRKMVAARNGLNVKTTLDPDAQRIATETAEQIMKKFHPHGVAIVIVDPSTGNIRALVSLPAYNANPLPTDPGKRPPITLAEVRDRCVDSLYEPGSTMKAFTLSYALDHGFITPETTFFCNGDFKLGRHHIHCAMGEKHGWVNAAKILRVSCNIGAAHVGLRMGGRNLEKAFQTFGLFDTPDIPIPGEARGHWSFDFSALRYSDAKIARAAFGQAVTTSPLLLTMGYAALANNGLLMHARIVSSLSNSIGKVVQQFPPQPVRQTVSPDVAHELIQMLEGVVTNGTGTAAAIPGYFVAGKTGTASLYKPGQYIGSFIGVVPATAPKVVILVAVNDPSQNGYYGAEVAAPAFQQIASRLMTLWRVPEDDPEDSQYKAANPAPKVQGETPTKPVTAAVSN